jgi:2-polyprenyl-6-methoxyphenol hydroxylase-like FAD-dependent oxidoreductase
VAEIVVCGAGVCGLLTAMLLADDGHDVTVVERDPAPPPAPADAWDAWERRGVTQFRLPHFLLPAFATTLSRELPAVHEAFLAAGAHAYDFGLVHGVTARRPVLESAVASAAAAASRVTIRRGAAIAGLVRGEDRGGLAWVRGVRLEDGSEVPADLVVDATGRRSPLSRWLGAVGAVRPVEEEEDSGFVYYGCHVRTADGSPPVGMPVNAAHGSVSLLALPADRGTAGVGIITCSDDAPLRRLREREPWRRVLGALPGGAPLLDCEQISPLVAMAGIEDRWRRLVVDGSPVAVGVVAVADSLAATNPTLGRGISLGLRHAVALRDRLRADGVEDPVALATAFDADTEATLTPWYRSTIWWDRHRLAEVRRATGVEVDEPDDPLWTAWVRFLAVFGQDLALLDTFLDTIRLSRRPEEIAADPAVLARLAELGADAAPDAGPDRAELLRLVAA